MRAASGGPGRVGRLGWEDAEVEMEVPVRAQAQGGKNSYWSCIIKILLSGAWQSPTNPLLRTSQQCSTLLSRLLLRRLAWEELGARLAKSKARDEQGSWGGGGECWMYPAPASAPGLNLDSIPLPPFLLLGEE